MELNLNEFTTAVVNAELNRVAQRLRENANNIERQQTGMDPGHGALESLRDSIIAEALREVAEVLEEGA